MILGFSRAKQGLCHTKHGEAGDIILWALLTVFLVIDILNLKKKEDIHCVVDFTYVQFVRECNCKSMFSR